MAERQGSIMEKTFRHRAVIEFFLRKHDKAFIKNLIQFYFDMPNDQHLGWVATQHRVWETFYKYKNWIISEWTKQKSRQLRKDADAKAYAEQAKVERSPMDFDLSKLPPEVQQSYKYFESLRLKNQKSEEVITA